MLNSVGFKIPIYPTGKQKILLNEYFGIRRFIYNIGIEIQEEHYQLTKNTEDYKLYGIYDANDLINKIREKYKWLEGYDRTNQLLVLKDVCKAYRTFLNGINRRPKFKTKRKSKKSFPIRSDRLKIYQNKIYIPSVGYIKSTVNNNDILGAGYKTVKLKYIKYRDCRISYDGIRYYLSFYIEESPNIQINSCSVFKNNKKWDELPYTKPIGIDLGLKKNNWIVDSVGNRVANIDDSKQIKKISRLYKKLSRQRNVNNTIAKCGLDNRNYTNRELKTIRDLNKYYKQITNKRKTAIYQYCNKLLELKPSSVVIEDIKYSDILKKSYEVPNKKTMKIFRHNIAKSWLNYFGVLLSRKLIPNGINVIKAKDDYPSSQLCSVCGYRQNIGRKTTYTCQVCGNVIDRDLNAAINLSYLG